MPTTQSQDFIASGTFVVPAGVGSVFLTLVAGGGGGGGAGFNQNANGAGGGGGGEFCRRFPVKVVPGDSISVVIGAGGAGQSVLGQLTGLTGGDSVFGPIRVVGGWGGARQDIGASSGLHTGCFAGGGGDGGGVGGWRGTSVGSCSTSGGNALNPGKTGVSEGPWMFGGSGGGGGGGQGPSFPAGSLAASGGGCEGQLGGAGGLKTVVGNSGGGGGAASPFGPGGVGGDGRVSGHDAPVASYGAGGGGGGGSDDGGTGTGGFFGGGRGASGYCFVDWVA